MGGILQTELKVSLTNTSGNGCGETLRASTCDGLNIPLSVISEQNHVPDPGLGAQRHCCSVGH